LTLALGAQQSKQPTSLPDPSTMDDSKHWYLMRKAMQAKGTGKDAHHIVPLESYKKLPLLMQKAAEGGFDIDGKSNGILLKRGEDHNGGHPIYNKEMLRKLSAIDPCLSPRSTARAVDTVAYTMKKAIKNKTFGPWG